MLDTRLKRFLTAGVIVALSLHVIVLAAFVWSRGGQTTVVEVQKVDGEFRALTDQIVVTPNPLDGRPSAALDVPEGGPIVLVLGPAIASLPRPSGIDRVVVRDTDRNVLFEDDFAQLDLDTWAIVSGDFKIDDGVLTALRVGEMNSLLLQGPGWTDYSVEVTYRNSRGGIIGSYLTESGGLYYHFELIRDFPNFFTAINNGEETASVNGSLMRSSLVGPTRSFFAMATASYPYVMLGLGLGALLTLGLALVATLPRNLKLRPLRMEGFRVRPEYIAVAALSALAFGVSYYIHVEHYSGIPHVPDEVSYLFQAHLLSSFRITGDIPPVSEAFQFYSPAFLYERGDQWASFYPFGHPLLLAVGVTLGLVQMMPSLVGAACVPLLFALGRRLYGTGTALVAAILLVASPFFLMQSSNFMSHNTGVFYILISLFFIVKRDRPVLYGAIAGLAFGLGVNTRPLPMVALMLPFGGLLLSYLVIQKEDLRTWLRHSAGFFAGGLLMGIALLAYNYGVTGDPLTTTYAGAGGPSTELFGFGNGHTLDIGLRNQAAQLMALLMVFNGWPMFVGVALIGLPFLLGTRNPWDYFLALCALLPIAVHVAYRYSGIYEGPRYWYETMPFLILLSARGAEMARISLAGAAGWLRERMTHRTDTPRWPAGVVVYATIAVLIVWGSGSWLFGWGEEQDAPLIPYEAAARQGIFGVDDRLDQLARETDLENALVLVEPCGFFQSPACYGSVFLRNLPHFDGDVVWARYLPDRLDELLEAFPGRDVYIASWDPEVSIRPYVD